MSYTSNARIKDRYERRVNKGLPRSGWYATPKAEAWANADRENSAKGLDTCGDCLKSIPYGCEVCPECGYKLLPF